MKKRKCKDLDTIEDSRIRAKYSLTYLLYRIRYPELLQQLEAAEFDLKAVNEEVNWNGQSIDWWRPTKTVLEQMNLTR